jgi:hypothetical protein
MGKKIKNKKKLVLLKFNGVQICFFAFFSEIFFLLDELIQQVKVETSPEDK